MPKKIEWIIKKTAESIPKVLKRFLLLNCCKLLINLSDSFANVEILDKETGVSPGQACVFYSQDNIGDKVLGGGWIDKTYNKNLST